MKVTKLVHSCLLVEDQGTKILFDPGEYSYKEGVFSDIASFGPLDFLLITHEHQDHLHLPTVKEVVKVSPNVNIISNPSVKAILEKEGLKVSTEQTDKIEIEKVPHEKIWVDPPQNVLFRVFNKLTHPGDSFTFTKTTDILALPLQAPWGSMMQAFTLAAKLKPKFIIPIHDWHLRDEAREAFYLRGKEYFSKHGMEFYGKEKGVVYND